MEVDDPGRSFTGFWVVEPGREVSHTRVTPKLDLPYDTKVFRSRARPAETGSVP